MPVIGTRTTNPLNRDFESSRRIVSRMARRSGSSPKPTARQPVFSCLRSINQAPTPTFYQGRLFVLWFSCSLLKYLRVIAKQVFVERRASPRPFYLKQHQKTRFSSESYLSETAYAERYPSAASPFGSLT